MSARSSGCSRAWPPSRSTPNAASCAEPATAQTSFAIATARGRLCWVRWGRSRSAGADSDPSLSLDDGAPMTTEDVPYTFESMSLKGYLAYEAEPSGPRAGVLVVHDAGGLSDNIKSKTRALAGLGYVAFALDLFGDGRTVTDGLARIQELAPNLERERHVAQSRQRSR